MKRVRFLSASLENFMAFRQAVTFPMADVGLVHVRGENRVSQAADSNGCGKSALIVDGPAWVLFGETLRGLRADAVACRTTKGPAVGTVALDVGGGSVVVRRTARPSSLQLVDGDRGEVLYPDLSIRELQARVDSMLGFGLRTYRNAVVFGQGSFDRFAQADQAEQLRMLDEIQGLDFRAARDAAKAWAAQTSAALAEAGAEARRLDERIEFLSAEVERLADAQAAWARAKDARLSAASAAVTAARVRIKDAQAALEAAVLARDRLPVVRRAVAARAEAQRSADAAADAVRAAEHVRDVHGKAVASLDAQLESLRVGEEQFSRGRASRVKAVGEALERAAAREDGLGLRLSEALDAAHLLLKAEAWLADRVAKLVALAEAREAWRVAQRDIVAARVHDAEVRDRVETLLQNEACPTCRLKFNSAARGKVQAAYRSEVAAADEALGEAVRVSARAEAAFREREVAAAGEVLWNAQSVAALKLTAGSAERLEQELEVSRRDVASATDSLRTVEGETYGGDAVATRVRLDRSAAARDFQAAEVALGSARAGLADAEAALAEAPSVTAQDLAELEAAGSDAAVRQVERAAVEARDAAERACVERDVVVAETWPGTALLEGSRADLAALTATRAELAPRQRRTEATLAVAEYWVEAFGDRGLRSLLFDSVAGFLNDRLARHLSALAAGEVAVTVSALSALKGGGAREKISVATDWAWGGSGKGSGSCGQDRRVDLALFAALQDLAESRSARPFPVKVWDEPGDALDARGQELFARWVEREAGERGAGFLITHSQALAEAVRAQQTWTVVMERDGARLEMK